MFKRDIGIQPGALKTERIGVAPLMAGQMPVVVVSGGERQVDRRRHAPPGDSPLPLGRRRLQYFFFWPNGTCLYAHAPCLRATSAMRTHDTK